MRPKSLLLLTLALGCGLIASVGINRVIASRQAAPAVVGETAQIFVALSEINMNDLIQPEMIKLETWPKDKVPPGAITQLDLIQGRRTRTKFYAGEPILDPKLFAEGEDATGATANIPKGFSVVAVHADAVSTGGNLVMPGDRVDVLLFVPPQPHMGVHDAMTKTLLQRVKVFSVNETTERPEGTGQVISARTIGLLVTPSDAELLTMASELGNLRLSLRNAEDDTTDASEGLSARDLLGGRSTTDSSDEARQSGQGTGPDAAPPAAPAGSLLSVLQEQFAPVDTGPRSAAPAENVEQHTMVVLRGPARESFLMETHEDGYVEIIPSTPRAAGYVPAGGEFAAAGPGDDSGPSAADESADADDESSAAAADAPSLDADGAATREE